MKMDALRFIGVGTVDLPLLGSVASGPFVLKSVEGLGPPEITVKMARTVLEKAIYQGKTVALRQVTCLIGLQPNWDSGQTPEQLRTQLYSLLTTKGKNLLKMEVRHNNVVQAYAEGQISGMIPALFTKDPAIQLTVDFDYPYLLAPADLVQQPASYSAGAGLRAFDIENDGTAPAGFRAGFVLTSVPSGPLVLSEVAPNPRRIQIDDIAWGVGDRFVVDTNAGQRGVWRTPSGGGSGLTNIINNLNGEFSEWMQLYGGVNTLTLNTSGFTWDSTYKFTHRPAYWGV